MDTPSADDIRHHLTRFEQVVDSSARHLAGSSCSGTWYASAPYYEKCRIRQLLHALKDAGGSCKLLEDEYCRIVKKLDGLAAGREREYREFLLADLRDLVHAYHAEICFSHIGSNSQDALSLRIRRDVIAELFSELSGHYDLSAPGMLVTVMDENALAVDALMSVHPAGDQPLDPGLSVQDFNRRPYSCPGQGPSARHV
jgi:hypothetical protein